MVNGGGDAAPPQPSPNAEPSLRYGTEFGEGVNANVWASQITYVEKLRTNLESRTFIRSVFMLKMPYSLVWQHSLSKVYEGQKAFALISRAQRYYDEYYAQHSAETDRATDEALP
jgi:hypothetical protein